MLILIDILCNSSMDECVKFAQCFCKIKILQMFIVNSSSYNNNNGYIYKCKYMVIAIILIVFTYVKFIMFIFVKK